MTNQETTGTDVSRLRIWWDRQRLLFYYKLFTWSGNRLGSANVRVILGDEWDRIFEEAYAKWKRTYGPEIVQEVMETHSGKTGIRVPERRDIGSVRDPR